MPPTELTDKERAGNYQPRKQWPERGQIATEVKPSMPAVRQNSGAHKYNGAGKFRGHAAVEQLEEDPHYYGTLDLLEVEGMSTSDIHGLAATLRAYATQIEEEPPFDPKALDS